MLRSTNLGKILGIQVHIHWTFWLLMIFYALSATFSAGPVAGLMTGLLFGLVFACVLAHEFGHALTARAFGVPTLDITLLPIGGLARLARIPESPVQELLIALAGPAVNVVIAAGLCTLLPLQALAEISRAPALVLGSDLIGSLLVANVALVVFNLLPAFPMDGGRVLRSLIAMRTSHLRATEIAARVGRWMALLFVMAGLWWGHLELSLVGLFVFMAGTSELWSARARAAGAAGPQAFQFTWTTVQPGNMQGSPMQWSTHTWPGGEPTGSQTNPSTHPSARDIVIDAVDVREVGRLNLPNLPK